MKDGSPIMAMVTRLVGHKGVDLVQAIVRRDLLQQGMRAGHPGLRREPVRELSSTSSCARNPGRVGVYIALQRRSWRRKIYAGADIFLMPSQL